MDIYLYFNREENAKSMVETNQIESLAPAILSYAENLVIEY